MSEYIVKGAEPNETVLHTRTPNGYEEWRWLPVREEVVRCKNCRHYDRDNIGGAMFDAHICWAWNKGSDYPCYTHRDGFCHRGERKDA